MDRNQFIGLILIGAILMGYVLLTKKNAADLPQQQPQDTSTTIIDTTAITNDTILHNLPDTLQVVQDTSADSSAAVFVEKFGDFANAAQGEEKFISIENNKIKLRVSTKGGRVYSAELTEYKTYNQQPLILFSGDKNTFNFTFTTRGNVIINTQDLYFEPVNSDTLVDAKTKEQKLTLRAKVSDNQYLEYVYTLRPDDFMVDFDVNFINLNDIIPRSNTFLSLNWTEYVRHQERGEDWERRNTLLYYKLYQAGVEKLANRKDVATEDITVKVRWISYKQQFFNTTLFAKEYFENAKLTCTKVPETDTVNLFVMSSDITVPYHSSDNQQIQFAYYFGPNKYSILKKIKIGDDKMLMQRMIPLGGKWLSWINTGLFIPMFNFLSKFISNYGIIILIITLLIKLFLFPLTYKSYASAAKMRILKPEIDKALEKIPKDKQMERQQATMNLYKKAGVNPMGGCLPTLLQFPILVALYRFFPASIELRQKAFLWVKDLSTYDAIVSWSGNIPILNWIFGHHISLFTLLMAVAMVFSTMLNSQNMDSSNQQAKSMKYMMYLMPLMMIVWFNNYSAALSYYYFLSTLISIIQIYIIRSLIDEKKVLAQMRENMKKPMKDKKSNFQKRLEEMQKQQAQQRNKNKRR